MEFGEPQRRYKLWLLWVIMLSRLKSIKLVPQHPLKLRRSIFKSWRRLAQLWSSRLDWYVILTIEFTYCIGIQLYWSCNIASHHDTEIVEPAIKFDIALIFALCIVPFEYDWARAVGTQNLWFYLRFMLARSSVFSAWAVSLVRLSVASLSFASMVVSLG